MTTPTAEAKYLGQHKNENAGKQWAIFNPYGKNLEDLPIIYGFNNGGGEGFLHAQLLAEDGTALGSHACSQEGYMEHDLGILQGCRPDRHETFKSHYPDGYRMKFIRQSEVKSHAGLNEAYKKNQLL